MLCATNLCVQQNECVQHYVHCQKLQGAPVPPGKCPAPVDNIPLINISMEDIQSGKYNVFINLI